jgi:hypothetical protein
VNIPADVVDRLTPHTQSGLSQPWATIIAAAIALFAAFFAYMGIRTHVRAAASQAAATREAEERREARSERVQLLSDALDASNEVQRTVTDARSAAARQSRVNVSADVFKRPRPRRPTPHRTGLGYHPRWNSHHRSRPRLPICPAFAVFTCRNAMRFLARRAATPLDITSLRPMCPCHNSSKLLVVNPIHDARNLLW